MTTPSPTCVAKPAIGPLAGVKIIEFEGIGPAPYCGMLLADMGADVVRIVRPAKDRGPLIPDAGTNPLDRGRSLISLNLKDPTDLAAARALLHKTDALIEGLRPGVMERLGLGPAGLHAVNPRLVYGRITGWGQTGPWAQTAGHDLTYIALSGALAAMGEPGKPPMPPLNLVGDYGGGGLFAAFGIVSALFHALRTGQGQVVDAAMVDGAASQMTWIYGLLGQGHWSATRGENFLDGGAPFYRCYTCADGRYLAVAPIEPPFFALFMQMIGLNATDWDQADRSQWPACAAAIAAVISTRSRDDWAAHFSGSDACVAPVLTMQEAPNHPHNITRATFAGSPAAPAPSPRFSQTPAQEGAITTTDAQTLLDRWD